MRRTCIMVYFDLIGPTLLNESMLKNNALSDIKDRDIIFTLDSQRQQVFAIKSESHWLNSFNMICQFLKKFPFFNIIQVYEWTTLRVLGSFSSCNYFRIYCWCKTWQLNDWVCKYLLLSRMSFLYNKLII